MSVEALRAWLSYDVYGVSLYTAGLAFVVVFVALLLRRLLVRVVVRGLLRLAATTEHTWDEEVVEALRRPLELLVVVYGLWLAAKVLVAPLELPDVVGALDIARRVAFLLAFAWTALRLVGVLDSTLRKRAADPDDPVDQGVVPLISNSLRIVIVMIFGTVVAQNLGYSVSGLLASLGLGGAALALASRDAIANLFGFLMILIDKPFKVGDWIRGGDFEGIVEEIGFRSTRIRTFQKTVENIPNNVMANAYVENLDRRKDAGLNVRRVSMTVGVTYQTTPEQMEKALEALRKVLHDDPGVDRRMTTLVYFTDFGASSLDIFLYYFTNKASWEYYLQVRERVNLSIMRALADLGLEIAFPTRTVHLESIPAALGGGAADGAGVARPPS